MTSGDGFVTHMDTSRSTSGELPPQLVGVGPPAPPGQPNLEFLPVLPPMHVHSHPVTTGQGPPVRASHVQPGVALMHSPSYLSSLIQQKKSFACVAEGECCFNLHIRM